MSESFQEFCKRILPVVQAGADGKKIKTKPRDRDHWNPVGENCGVLRRCLEYRIVEPKATPLPITPEMWAMINPFYVCAVMTDCGEVLFCSQVTEWSDDVRKFGCEYGFGDNCKSPLNIDTTGIIPELSLTKRPDVVNGMEDSGSSKEEIKEWLTQEVKGGVFDPDLTKRMIDDMAGASDGSIDALSFSIMGLPKRANVDATHYTESITGNHVDLYKRDPLNKEQWMTWDYQNPGWIKVQFFGVEPNPIK